MLDFCGLAGGGDVRIRYIGVSPQRHPDFSQRSAAHSGCIREIIPNETLSMGLDAKARTTVERGENGDAPTRVRTPPRSSPDTESLALASSHGR